MKSIVPSLSREIYQFSQSPPKLKDIQSNLRCSEQQDQSCFLIQNNKVNACQTPCKEDRELFKSSDFSKLNQEKRHVS